MGGLLRRYRLLHSKPTKYQMERLDVIEAALTSGAPEGAAWRKRQLALMGDVSAFMKLLKQRFAIWFNKAHQRYGTLSAERFKSVLVESQKNALRTMALYIDLNPVRTGLVADPKDYRFCGTAKPPPATNPPAPASDTSTAATRATPTPHIVPDSSAPARPRANMRQ